MHKEFETSTIEQRVIEEQQDSVCNMAQLVELITLARYGMPEGKLGFETDFTGGIVQISFGPVNKSYKNMDDLKEDDPVFYNSMRRFLSDLQDAAAGPTLNVDLDNLGIAAKGKMTLFNALESMVDDEQLNLSTMDASPVLKTEEEQNWPADKVCSRIHDLADGCDRLKSKHDETFEYLLLNAPVRPYLSLEHFKACLASRVEVDITMSLDNLKKQILLEEYSGDKLVANLAKVGVYYN